MQVFFRKWDASFWPRSSYKLNLTSEHNNRTCRIYHATELAGIVTSSDVMTVLLEARGTSNDSVVMKDSIGKLTEVQDILNKAGVNIQSIFCWPEKEYPGKQNAIRINRVLSH